MGLAFRARGLGLRYNYPQRLSDRKRERMRYVTAGESHGPELVAIVEDVPAGLKVSAEQIDYDLSRRQSGYGRGGRMTIERDHARIVSGVRFGRTLGSPVALVVENRDWANWTERMAADGQPPADLKREVTPRPGHADLVGALRTNTDDCRNILERASARETAARVAAAGHRPRVLGGAGGGNLLLCGVGGGCGHEGGLPGRCRLLQPRGHRDFRDALPRCCGHRSHEAGHQPRPPRRREPGGHLPGGGHRPGAGPWHLRPGKGRLTGQLGAALFSIPAIKGVEFGLGFEAAQLPGSQVHDPILLEGAGFDRASNNAGGLEGGMTSGLPLVVTAAMKPIPTLMTPLSTVNLETLAPEEASKERSDVCAVPAAAVVAEAEVAFVLASAYQEAFGGTCMADIRRNLEQYKGRLRAFAR